MINFRFHLVSLVAVFLALTIGIIVGATVVNGAIVDGLNNRLDTVEKNAGKQRDENKLLSANAKQLESYLKGSAPYVVEGRLTAVPVVLFAERGVDRGSVRGLATLIHNSGAQMPAIIWLESKWLLDKPEDRAALAEIVGGDADSPGLRARGIEALAIRFGTDITSDLSVATTTTVKGTPDLVSALTSAGFLSIEASGASGTTDLSTFPPPGARVVLLSGEASDLAEAPILRPMAAAFSQRDMPTIAGEIYHATDGQPPRGTVVAPIREDRVLSTRVSTVDNVDLVQGQVAVVLAAVELADAKVGHYGSGTGADGALPPWPGP